MRRLLAYQLMLTRKRGLPPSRLQLTLEEADARPSKREELKRIQEESASPMLKRKGAFKMKADNYEEKNRDLLDTEKEEEGHFSVGTSTGDLLPHFTPRSSQADPVTPTPFHPLQAGTSIFPFPMPSYTWAPSMPLSSFCTPSPSGPMPGQKWVICGSCHTWGTVILSH